MTTRTVFRGLLDIIVGASRGMFGAIVAPLIHWLGPHRERFVVRNLANAISVSRLVLSIWVDYQVAVAPNSTERWLFLVLVLVLIISDGLDGALARGLGTISHFGAVIDPLGDKVLIGGLVIGLSYRYDSAVFTALVLLLLVVEFGNIVVGYIGNRLALRNGVVAGAGTWGKVKFGTECLLVMLSWGISSASIGLSVGFVLLIAAIFFASMSLRAYTFNVVRHTLPT